MSTACLWHTATKEIPELTPVTMPAPENSYYSIRYTIR